MGDSLTLPDVRSWGVREGLLKPGSRGPVSIDVRRAHALAHGLPEPESTPKKTTPIRERPFAGAECSDCGRRWEGHAECHCRRCHLQFRNVGAFDLHLTGVPGSEDTRCLGVDEVRYRSGAQKGYPKLKVVDAHHGPLITRAGERPEEINA